MPRKLKVFEAKDFTLASAEADLGLPHSYLSLRWFAEYYGHTKVETQQARKITEEKLQEHGLCDDAAEPEELDERRHLLASFLLESHASLFRNRWIGDPGKQEWFNATLETDGYSVHCGIQAWISVVSDNLRRKQKRQGNYVRRDQGSGSITQSIEESSPDPIAISGKESSTNNKPPQVSRCGLSQLASRAQSPSGTRAPRSISGVSACSPPSLLPPPSRLPSPSNTTSSARIPTDDEIELQLYDVHKTPSSELRLSLINYAPISSIENGSRVDWEEFVEFASAASRQGDIGSSVPIWWYNPKTSTFCKIENKFNLSSVVLSLCGTLRSKSNNKADIVRVFAAHDSGRLSLVPSEYTEPGTVVEQERKIDMRADERTSPGASATVQPTHTLPASFDATVKSETHHTIPWPLDLPYISPTSFTVYNPHVNQGLWSGSAQPGQVRTETTDMVYRRRSTIVKQKPPVYAAQFQYGMSMNEDGFIGELKSSP
ncbi:hypothetical protein B9Z65_3024 [Elsinoe australis]|uniref:Uncharacterized protein n=1 Tax=Elsinoe australis TaxID=40998 RepID=A0A2P7ZU61_9PEZI|nr:hypothetical protein B9Z65_3024 [Elsinoe australis]